jgi:hypothetical protein
VKNSLYCKVRTDLSVNNLEILWVEIRNSNNDKFLVGDYNCDMLSNSSNYFKKILNRLNLENVVFEATNFTTETGTCIN